MLLIPPQIDFQKLLEFLAEGYTDPLTGCLNTRAFRELQSPKQKLLYYLDLDNLKSINDREGHDAGDKYISDNADKLKQTFKREDDLIFRIGGDEFIVISDYPAELTGLECFSIGVSLISQDLESAIKKADSLMYKNKRGKTLDNQMLIM